MKVTIEMGKLDDKAIAFAPLVINDRSIELFGIYLLTHFITIKISI
jgi:hypothetical protein